jgi:hypothetical protein
MSWFDFLLCFVFIMWGAASIAYQFEHPVISGWSYHDCFGILPLWTFFAPSPGQSDYHLLYRDKFDDGSLSPWTEVPLTDPRKLHSWIWNPEKRTKKVLADVVQMLIRIVAEGNVPQSTILLSTPYTLILNNIMHFPRLPAATGRQFVIAQTAGFFRQYDPQPMIRSFFHRF